MKRNPERTFRLFAIIILCFYLFQYITETTGLGVISYPVVIDATIFSLVSAWYLWLYRRQNLLCFEIMALPIAFLGLFFQDIIAPILPDALFHSISDHYIRIKSADLQMIGYMSFFVGCAFANRLKRGYNLIDHSRNYNYKVFFNVILALTIIVVLYDYATGVFHKWFLYSNLGVLDKEEKSEGLGLLTDLIIIMTLIDVIRLKEAGVSSFREYIKKCNKFCVAIWLLISALLLISGNRNEMLLVLLPCIVAYTICIQPIKSRHILLALFIGVFLMVASGTTRHDGFGISGGVYNLMTLTADFSNLGYDCDYLVQYTDKFGSTNFKGMTMVLLSGIPFIGHHIVDFLGLEGVVTTPDLTTESVGSESGLGTSIIGDMYYTSGMLWVLVYMFFYGYFMSRLYYSNKNVSIYLLFIYTYLVANAVYYIRSSWYFPITRLEYVCIIIFIGRLLFKNGKKNSVQL